MANSATVGLLRVLMSANTAEFEAAMKRSADSAKEWTRELKSIGQQATQVGTALTKTLTLPLAALGIGAVKAAMDFESSFANVAKTVDGVSDKAGKLTKAGEALANTFREMAKEIPATTTELNAIAALGGQMGVPIDQLAHFTKNVAALGVAVDGISTEEAAAGLAQIGNVAGKGTTDIAKMASALVHLGNSSSATEGSILEFTKRLIGAGHSVGMTVPEVMALGTAMANVGLNAEAGGTAMSTVIGKMSKAVSMGGEALREFARVAGTSAEEFAAVWKRSPIEAIDLFVKGLGRVKAEGGDLNLTMGEIGTEGIRVADTLKRLAGAGTGVADSLKVANEGFEAGNKHLEEAEKKYATTANQLKVLWNQIRDVGMTIGNALLPAIQSSIGFMKTLIPIVDNVAKGFALLPGPIQAAIVGVGLLVAAAGPMIFLFGQLAISAAALTTTFTANGIATKLLSASVGNLTKAWVFLQTPITVATVRTAALTAAQWLHFAATSAITGATVGLTGAVSRLWAVLAAHPFVAVTAAIGIATVALTNFIEKRAQAELDAQTAAAKQDTINLAIQRGAKATIQYADAVKYLQQFEAIRLAQFDKSAAAQQKRIEAELALGRITKEQANNQLLAIGVEIKANEVRANRVSLSESLKQAERQIQEEIKATGLSMGELLAGLKQNEAAFKKWAEQNKLSAETVAFLEAQLKKQTTVQKEVAKETDKATKEFEKQQAALEKLGIVTDKSVNKALNELAELELQALAGGAKYNAVLAALLPQLEQLHAKAVASGVGVEATAAALRRAEAAAKAFTDELFRLGPQMPRVVDGLKEIPGTVQKIDLQAVNAAHSAKLLTEAYHSFGMKTRAELIQLARDAEFNYRQIVAAVGEHAPEAVEAFRKMVEAQKAASMELPTFWESVIGPSIVRVVDDISGGLARGFATMLTGAQSFADGFKGIWESIKQSALNVFAQILDAFINGMLKRMIAALAGSAVSGGFSWTGLAQQALGLAGGGGGAGGGWLGIAQNALGLAGAGGAIAMPALAGNLSGVLAAAPATSAVMGAGVGGAGAGGVGAGAAAAGGMSGVSAALLAGGLTVGGGIAGGMVGKEIFGGPGVGAGSFGAATGAAIGTLIMPGIGTAIGALAGFLSGFLGKGPGRSMVEHFAKSQGGFDELHKKLNQLGEEGEQLWITLTQGVGKNNKEQAKAAIEAVTAALNAHQQKTLETARAVEEAAQRETAARQQQLDQLQAGLEQLDQEYESLAQSIANEAPEEIMGIVEAQTRARMAQIDAERENVKRQMDDLKQQTEQAAIETRERIEEILGGIQINVPITFELPEGGIPKGFDSGLTLEELEDWLQNIPVPDMTTMDAIPSFQAGTQGKYVDFGKETLAVLHGKEKITPYGHEQPSGAPLQAVVILEMDKRAFGRAVADVLPGEVRRLGVRVLAG